MQATKHIEEFNALKRHEQKYNTPAKAKSSRREILINCIMLLASNVRTLI